MLFFSHWGLNLCEFWEFSSHTFSNCVSQPATSSSNFTFQPMFPFKSQLVISNYPPFLPSVLIIALQTGIICNQCQQSASWGSQQTVRKIGLKTAPEEGKKLAGPCHLLINPFVMNSNRDVAVVVPETPLILYFGSSSSY